MLFAQGVTFGQSTRVSTLNVSGLNGPNGMAVDNVGNIYVASEPGKSVTRISGDGKSEIIITCDSPDGLDFDRDGNLVISNFYSGVILVQKNNRLDTLVEGLHHPSDIKFDKQGNLYITEYDKNDVMAFTSQGKLELVIKDIVHPFGVAVGKDNVLFVSSNTTGEIYKVTNNQKSLLATIPGSVSYLAYSEKTEKIYATCYSCHTIFSVTKKGEMTVIAGTGEAGYKDGSPTDAQFDGPNSVVLSKSGDLYVSEFKHNRIRKIERVE